MADGGNWVSVEQALTKSGIFEDFENKVIALSEANIKQLMGYIDKLKSYEKDIDQMSKSLKIRNSILKTQRKLSKTQEVLDQNNQDWGATKNLKNVYKTARGFYEAGTTVEKLKLSQSEFEQDRDLQEFAKHGIIGLMKLEQDIIKSLYEMNFFKQRVGDEGKGHNPIVDTYVFYFYGDKNDNTQEIIRGQISSDDEAFMKNLVVNSAGEIELSVSIIKDMMQTQYEIVANAKDPTRMDNTYQIYMDELIKEAGSFYNDIVRRVAQILRESKSMHLSNDKDSELDAGAIALYQKNFVEDVIAQHQENLRQFLYSNQRYDSGAYKNRINRGHLAEAFERLYQAHRDANPGEPNIDYATAVQESLGNDPWYMQGDVGTSQVKSFFDRNNRAVASFHSLQSLFKNLIMILNSILSGNKENLIKIQKTAEYHYKKQEKEIKAANAKLEQDCILQTAKRIVAEAFKSS